AIGWIDRVTAVATFLDVIGEHAMRRLCLVTALAVLGCLAAAARPGDDLFAPGQMLFRLIERISLLRCNSHRAPGSPWDQGRQHPDPPHAMPSLRRQNLHVCSICEKPRTSPCRGFRSLGLAICFGHITGW